MHWPASILLLRKAPNFASLRQRQVLTVLDLPIIIGLISSHLKCLFVLVCRNDQRTHPSSTSPSPKKTAKSATTLDSTAVAAASAPSPPAPSSSTTPTPSTSSTTPSSASSGPASPPPPSPKSNLSPAPSSPISRTQPLDSRSCSSSSPPRGAVCGSSTFGSLGATSACPTTSSTRSFWPTPSAFRLIASATEGDPRAKFVEAAANPGDPTPVSAIEKAREAEYRAGGSDAEDARFSFLVNFPPGFKIGKYYRIAVWKWQRLPYWSPYEDVSGYDLRSLEARRRMEKRAVATIHEILSLMVEKRTTLERIAHFRQAMGLPNKLKEFLLQHQGIFYVSTRGNQGKLHTVFLREAYRKGEMVEPNEIYLARRKLGELLLMSPKKANVDRMLTSMGRGRGDYERDEGGSDNDSGVESQTME